MGHEARWRAVAGMGSWRCLDLNVRSPQYIVKRMWAVKAGEMQQASLGEVTQLRPKLEMLGRSRGTAAEVDSEKRWSAAEQTINGITAKGARRSSMVVGIMWSKWILLRIAEQQLKEESDDP
ncbi:hypothetical protein CYMTET_17027 [Cymbomonas tetramitiformis]|uniref:Uncharacterized protein n=1 Tax=Cymbomonas tetramitiformis TaxID=36881 RepID=A0AAE0GB34_9CHLO|nr:hypothetical protein CYMTET_17027 [Cymbomonas tetramitiformis]